MEIHGGLNGQRISIAIYDDWRAIHFYILWVFIFIVITVIMIQCQLDLIWFVQGKRWADVGWMLKKRDESDDWTLPLWVPHITFLGLGSQAEDHIQVALGAGKQPHLQMIYDDLLVRNGDCPKTIFRMVYVYPPITWQFFRSPRKVRWFSHWNHDSQRDGPLASTRP